MDINIFISRTIVSKPEHNFSDRQLKESCICLVIRSCTQRVTWIWLLVTNGQNGSKNIFYCELIILILMEYSLSLSLIRY